MVKGTSSIMPVRISGPFVSKAIATADFGNVFSWLTISTAFRTFSIVSL